LLTPVYLKGFSARKKEKRAEARQSFSSEALTFCGYVGHKVVGEGRVNTHV
jgi:hypothetical protein